MRTSVQEVHPTFITLARLTPDHPPVAHVRALQERYRDPADPVAAATPVHYRRAMWSRISHFLLTRPKEIAS